MTTTKSPRFVHTLAAVFPASAMLLAMPALSATPAGREASPALIGAGLATSSSVRSLDSAALAGATGERIRLAAKLSKAIRAGAVGSRVGRGSDKAEQQDTAASEPEAEAEAEAETSQPEGEATPNGPFKVMIPGQSEAAATNAPAPPAPAVAAPAGQPANPATTTSGPVRTILDRTAVDRASKQPAGSQPAAPAAASTAVAIPAAAQRQADTPVTAESSCIAGCYAPTSAQLMNPTGRRVAGAAQSGRAVAPPAAAQSGIQCLAGCDGIEGTQLPRIQSGAASVEGPPSQSGTNRVVILRGNTRSKSYGVGQ